MTRELATGACTGQVFGPVQLVLVHFNVPKQLLTLHVLPGPPVVPRLRVVNKLRPPPVPQALQETVHWSFEIVQPSQLAA